MKYIKDKLILGTLDSLYSNASKDFKKLLPLSFNFIFNSLQPKDCKDAYLPLDRQQGEFLYDYIVSNQTQNIVEFGTSFGISTIFLAAGARETGGKVITSELLPEKCKVALENFNECNLSEYIELREGNGLETLANLEDNIDLLILDGWSDLYLPILKLLEPKLSERALIYADNASFPSMKSYLAHVSDTAGRYTTEIIKVEKGKVAMSYKVN